jgi:uncharacterized protein (DUF2164 family)
MITLSSDQKNHLINQLQQYFEAELAQDLGQFEAEFLIDFLAENFGVHYYNKGLEDAQTIVSSQAEELIEIIDEAIKPIPKV